MKMEPTKVYLIEFTKSNCLRYWHPGSGPVVVQALETDVNWTCIFDDKYYKVWPLASESPMPDRSFPLFENGITVLKELKADDLLLYINYHTTERYKRMVKAGHILW